MMWILLRWSPFGVRLRLRQKNRTAVCEAVQAPALRLHGAAVVHSLLDSGSRWDGFILRLRSDIFADAPGSPLLFA